MKFLYVLLGIAVACRAETYEEMTSRLMPALNSAQKTWKAGYNTRFSGMGEAEMKQLCGTFLDKVEGFPTVTAERRASPPDTFDARQQWPSCPSIGEVRDQSSCGSCWAFGAVEVASDRTCIKNGQTADISPEDMLDCCKTCGFGCNGGYPIMAMNWWQSNGVVTGGNYGSNDGCMPYSIKPCPSGCPLSPTPKCNAKCRTGYDKTYAEDKHHAASAYNVQGSESNIRQEIFNNGPVEAAFQVYQDFYTYHTGVYHHVSGSYVGGHAVKIIGWGTESGTPYWLVVNSWNTTWGDNGMFKIKRGNNECGFESGIVAGLAKD
jgi:cathepsin B